MIKLSPAQEPAPSPAGSALVWLILFLGLSFLLYGHTLAYPFQFDDGIFLEDGNVQAGNWERFLWPPIPRALVWMSFAGQLSLIGAEPSAFRLLDIALHGLNAFLIFLLCRQIIQLTHESWNRPFWPALVGALLFLLHPLQTEPVIYIYQRSTLLSLAFFLLTIYVQLGWSRSLKTELLIGVCLVAALLTKEWTLLLPVVLWLAQGLIQRDWRPRAVFLFAAGFSMLAAFRMFYWMRDDPTLGTGSPLDYARFQALVWWKYLRLILVPVGQSIDHDMSPSAPSWSLASLCLGGLVLLLGTIIWNWRKQPGQLLGLAIFLLSLIPTSSLIPAQDPLFEHRLYAPLAGIAVIACLSLLRLQASGRVTGFHLGLLSTLVLAVLATLTVVRSRDWRSEASLWTTAVEQAPNKYRPRLNLGRLVMDSEPASAKRHLVRAIELRPDLPQAFRSLGLLKLRSGSRQTAAALWQQALLLEPGHAPTHLALGELWSVEHRYFEAKQELERALRATPGEIRAYRALARLERNFGFLDLSLDILNRGLLLWSHDLEMIRLRSEILFRQSRWSESAVDILHGLELATDNWGLLIRGGQVHEKLGDASQAGDFYRRAHIASQDESQRVLTERLLQALETGKSP